MVIEDNPITPSLKSRHLGLGVNTVALSVRDSNDRVRLMVKSWEVRDEGYGTSVIGVWHLRLGVNTVAY
jgi:hypothetical protein